MSSHNPMFKKLVMKKKEDGKELSDIGKKAKGNLLQELTGQMQGMMGDSVKGLKKVSVASNSAEGLKEGLEKAKEVVASKESKEDPEMEEMDEEDKMMLADGEDHESHEAEESVEELKKRIAELEAKISMKA